MSDDTVVNDVTEPATFVPMKPVIAVVEYPSFRRVVAHAANIAVDYAKAGVHEDGGNNRGDQVEFFQHMTGGGAGDSWCADFVSTCLVKSLCQLMGWPEGRDDLLSRVGIFGKKYMPVTGYCPTLWQEAKARGIFFAHASGHRPQNGCIVLYDFHQEGEPHHVGFQLDYATGKDVSGNTGPGMGGNQADGDGVYVRFRPMSRVFGWIDP